MASTFEDRARAALDNPRFRLADFEPLIAEAESLCQQQHALADQAARESLDFALSEADREEAAGKADRARRSAAALTAGVEALRTKLAERQASDKAQQRAAEREAAAAERDALAAEFRDVVPQAAGALVELFKRIHANTARLRAIGVLGEADAECVARGINPAGIVPVARFMEMKIPAWEPDAEARRLWPPESLGDPSNSIEDALRAARKAAKRRAAETEAQWGWYRLSAKGFGSPPPFRYRIGTTGHERDGIVGREPREYEILHTEAERLRGIGVQVQAIDGPAPEEPRRRRAEFA